MSEVGLRSCLVDRFGRASLLALLPMHDTSTHALCPEHLLFRASAGAVVNRSRILRVRRARPLFGALRLVELTALFGASWSLNGRLFHNLRCDLIKVHSSKVAAKPNWIVVGGLDGLRVDGGWERRLCDDVG